MLLTWNCCNEYELLISNKTPVKLFDVALNAVRLILDARSGNDPEKKLSSITKRTIEEGDPIEIGPVKLLESRKRCWRVTPVPKETEPERLLLDRWIVPKVVDWSNDGGRGPDSSLLSMML